MTMGSQQPVYVQAPAPTNGLGLAGFIVSLVGWVTCGILCPIGFIMSCIGVFRQPRGFAVAGIIIGLIGSLFGVAVLLIGLIPFLAMLGFVAVVSAVGASLPTYGAISTGEQRVHTQYVQSGALPADPDGAMLLLGLKDQWGHQLIYHKVDGTHYKIMSAGQDGVPGTRDDIEEEYTGSDMPSNSGTEPAGPGEKPEGPGGR